MPATPYKRLLKPRALLGLQRQRLPHLPQRQQPMRSIESEVTLQNPDMMVALFMLMIMIMMGALGDPD